MNMALCWTKLQNNDKALKSAGEALALEPAHPKALYEEPRCTKRPQNSTRPRPTSPVLKANEQTRPPSL